MKWTQDDLQAFAERGWSLDEVDAQRAQLEAGHGERAVEGPCRVGDGVVRWTERERAEHAAFARQRIAEGRTISAFVPASGAATRMFRDLHTPLRPEVAARLAEGWERLPFASELRAEGAEDLANTIADQILNRLQLQRLPKGHVPFLAQQGREPLTAFDAHRLEWLPLAERNLVFTVPVDFEANLPARYRAWQGVHWDIQFPETDTLAWDAALAAPARNGDGSLLFRPGGHGALLANLNALSTEAAVVRNIDNVVQEDQMPFRNSWRAALLGAAWHLTEEREALWAQLQRGEPGAEAAALRWLSEFVRDPEPPRTLDQWRYHLNRPIRVAGVVPNAGQPGGGPFWVVDQDGFTRPGIVEAAELPDGSLAGGTHFNPVDLALHFRGVNGEHLHLPDFADAGAYFTATKVVEGRELRILERPGLWNGGMAGWLTRFVELPAEVFAPVKTVFDLIRS